MVRWCNVDNHVRWFCSQIPNESDNRIEVNFISKKLRKTHVVASTIIEAPHITTFWNRSGGDMNRTMKSVAVLWSCCQSSRVVRSHWLALHCFRGRRPVFRRQEETTGRKHSIKCRKPFLTRETFRRAARNWHCGGWTILPGSQNPLETTCHRLSILTPAK